MTSIFSPCTCQLVTSPSQSKPLLKVEKNTKPPLQLPATPSPPPPKTITLAPSKHRPQNHFQKLAAKALDVLEFGLQTIEKSQPFPKTIDPDIQISGNYAPVSESEPTKALVVSGKIPTELCNGIYVRNGANPVFPPSSGHHLFDGDGMVHAVSFKGPYNASYTSHLTRTSRLKQEAAIGHAIFPKPIGELHGRSGLCRLALFYARTAAGILDSTQGIGSANAGLAYFNGKLLAMSEDDLPYHVDVTKGRDLRTVGRFDFDGQLDSPMIAHPKIDPVTGELFSLSYNLLKKPYLKYFRVDPNGKKTPDVSICLNEPTMIHDFAITESYAVIHDHQLLFDVSTMATGSSPLRCDEKKVARFGLLPRYDSDQSRLKWTDVPGCFCFHLWNAWEEDEGDKVVVIASCMTPPDAIFSEKDEKLKSVLSKITMDLKTGKSTRVSIVEGINLEMGQVNKAKVGRKARFVYMAITEPWPRCRGIAKVDVESGEMTEYAYGNGKYGGEPTFVATKGEVEDEGYVMGYVHDEEENVSELIILDAKSMDMVATVQLPYRVPYGFHGTFVSGEELSEEVAFM